MRYKLLGSSGLRVSEMASGTMAFGEDWGRFDAISTDELGFPNEFIARQRASSFVLGDGAR
jgi:hypothetical protein